MAIPSQLIADWKCFSQLGCRSNAQGGCNIANFAALFTAVINISGTTSWHLGNRAVSLDSQLDPVLGLTLNLVHVPAQRADVATSHSFVISAGYLQNQASLAKPYPQSKNLWKKISLVLMIWHCSDNHHCSQPPASEDWIAPMDISGTRASFSAVWGVPFAPQLLEQRF